MCVASNEKVTLGITGGIGSGKSTVARLFSLLGVAVYDADQAGKRLMETHASLRQAITAYFGTKAYDASQKVNKAYLAKYIFEHEKARQWLNQQVHPRVHQDFQQWKQQHACARMPYVVYESALLFEAGVHETLYRTLLIVAPVALRIKRILARDPWRRQADIQRIIRAQWPEVRKKQLATSCNTLHNDEKRLLIPQILNVHQNICQQLDTTISKERRKCTNV